MIWPGCQLFARQSPPGPHASIWRFLFWKNKLSETCPINGTNLLTHRYHLRQNNCRCESLIDCKTISVIEECRIIFASLFNSGNIMSAWTYRHYIYCRFLSNEGTVSVVRRCAFPSIHFFVSRSRSVVDCAHRQALVCVWCVCNVCVVCVCVCCGGGVCSVRGGVWCVVSVDWCVCVGAGVGVRCVVCGVCVAAWHTENPLCASSKASPCVGSKRLYVQHAMLRFEPTHRREGGSFSSLLYLCLALSFSLSLVPSSFSPFVLFLLLFLYSLLSDSDNDHSSNRLSLCTHGSDLPAGQSACLGPSIPCPVNMVASCKKL